MIVNKGYRGVAASIISLHPFLKQSLKPIRASNKQLSQKRKGSRQREKARKHLLRQYDKVANQRCDWFWQLAHQLTDSFDRLCFETLHLKGMKHLWGRKVCDLALGDFLQIVEWVATKKGKQVVYIDPWYPNSKTCSNCSYVLKSLDLSTREWQCPCCRCYHRRDWNAANNIKAVGTPTVGLGKVRQTLSAIAARTPLHRLNPWEWVKIYD